LPVDAQSVQQLGAAELGAQQAHVQRHEARVGALAVGHARVPHRTHTLRFGEEAVDKVDPGPAHRVNQRILEEERQDGIY